MMRRDRTQTLDAPPSPQSETDRAAPLSTRRRGGPAVVALLGLATALGPFSMSVHIPALPGMADDLGASQAAVQLTLTACVIGLAFGQLLAGPVTDALGRRLPLAAALAVYTAASLACAFAPTIPVLVGLRVLQGLSAAFGMVIARAVLRDVATGPTLVRHLARMAIVTGLAPIIAPNLGGLLLRVTDWRGIFAVLALIGVILALGTAVLLRETLPGPRRRRPGARSVATGYGRLAADPLFLAPALVGGLAYAAMFSYVSSSSFVFTGAYGMSITVFSVMFGLNGAGFVFGAQICAAFSARWGVRRVMRAALASALLGALALVGLASAGTVIGVVIALSWVVTSIGGAMTLAAGAAMDAHHGRAGAASGMFGFTQFAIGGSVGTFSGVFGAASALPLGAIMGGCLLSALLLSLSVRPRPGVSRPR